jgi:hypothetical protein
LILTSACVPMKSIGILRPLSFTCLLLIIDNLNTIL